jgi:hypothetical protein
MNKSYIYAIGNINTLKTNNILKLLTYSILGLPLFFSIFIIENNQIHIFASKEFNNTTSPEVTSEIILSDPNGTELVQMSGEFHCPELPEGGCAPPSNPSDLLAYILTMNITMKDANDTEIINFENIPVKCTHTVEAAEPTTRCVQG